MDKSNKSDRKNTDDTAKAMQDIPSDLTNMEALSHYLKSSAGSRQGRSIPPLEKWHPEQVMDMDLVIKANGEWWHEGTHMTRESLVSLFATILWKEDQGGKAEYFLKTPVQKLRVYFLLFSDNLLFLMTENFKFFLYKYFFFAFSIIFFSVSTP